MQLPQTSLPSSIALSIPKEQKPKEEDPSQVKFMGPIPPPVRLPTKWKCAKDKYGRPYYYHIKIRKSQWEPPPPPPLVETPTIEETEGKFCATHICIICAKTFCSSNSLSWLRRVPGMDKKFVY